MSRGRTASSAQQAEQRALDLLARRAPIAADALLEAIHAINPTARSLAPAQQRRRYRLKAQLQSLLLRTFFDDLVISEEGHRVVAIRHRYLDQDACHAQLDDDARARVQWLLDTGATPDAASEGSPRVSAAVATAPGSRGAIEQGRIALDEFEYDAARACFERALAAAPGDAVAAARAPRAGRGGRVHTSARARSTRRARGVPHARSGVAAPGPR